jgi:hypothetical protein
VTLLQGRGYVTYNEEEFHCAPGQGHVFGMMLNKDFYDVVVVTEQSAKLPKQFS